MKAMDELFSPGQRVRIRIDPDCQQQFIDHGIAPRLNGLVGQVVRVEPERANQHYYWVMFTGAWETGLDHPRTVTNPRMYFAPSELEGLV